MTSISLKFRQDGAIESLKYKEIEFISSAQELFVMQARDLLGNPLQFSSKQFKKVEFQGDDRKLSIHFSGDELLLRRGSVTVTVENDGEEVRWGISAELGGERAVHSGLHHLPCTLELLEKTVHFLNGCS